MELNTPGELCILPKRSLSHLTSLQKDNFPISNETMRRLFDTNNLQDDSVYFSLKEKKLPQEVDEDNNITLHYSELKEHLVESEKIFEVGSKIKIGQGACGEVFKVIDKKGKKVALKEIKLTKEENLQAILIESKLHQRLDHVNIVKFLHANVDESKQKYCIYLEYIPTSLTRFLSDKYFRRNDDRCIILLRQLIDGVAYLHSLEIIHCDLKCDNVLVDDKGTLKICDFGFAHDLKNGNPTNYRGTPNFSAPEVCNPKPGFGKPADIWSIGCTCLEMLTGNAPFYLHDSMAIIFQVAMGILKIEEHITKGISRGFKHFLSCCWERDSSKRPTIEELFNFPVLTGGCIPSEDSEEFEEETPGTHSSQSLHLNKDEDTDITSYAIGCPETLHEANHNFALLPNTIMGGEMQSLFVGFASSIHTNEIEKEEEENESHE